MSLRPKDDVALAPTAEPNDLALFERMARDPQVDVDKFERLMAMRERLTARCAEEHFNAAMSRAQTDMRPVAADATNPQTRSTYASYAALDTALRPIYTKHGFGLSFDTGDGASADWVRVLCYVTHATGHARTYHADMPADGKGAKGGDVMTRTHAVGAAMSYGMRYLLKMIFNVAVGEDDRDGNAPPETSVPEPKGFPAWRDELSLVADEGLDALRAAWKASKDSYREYLTKHYAAEWNALKTKASRVKAQAVTE